MPAASSARAPSPARPARALLLLLLLGRTAADEASCHVCSNAVSMLTTALDETKSELEKAKQFTDKKAEKVDRVQKAQTRRWLKNEYAVALRAGVEDEVELVCTRDGMRVTPVVQSRCGSFLEEHDEALPRAVLAGEGAAYCAAHVPGCDAAGAARARAALHVAVASEPAPKATAKKVRGCVTRLVGSTFSTHTQRPEEHHLVLVHHGFAPAKGHVVVGGAAAVGAAAVGAEPYAALAAEFYAFAQAANGTARLRFGQIDTSKNGLPGGTPVAEPAGMGLLLYADGDKALPKPLPQVGGETLAGADAAAVKSRLSQFLHSVLPTKDTGGLTRVFQARSQQGAKADAVAKAQAQLGGIPGLGDMFTNVKVTAEGVAPDRPAAKPMAPRKRAVAPSKGGAAYARARACDVCGLVVGELGRALASTKKALQLSHDAAARKQAAIDSVQKAQTKRWLKQVYGSELAASVEDRLEKLCDDKTLFQPICSRAANREPDWQEEHDGQAEDDAWRATGDEAACAAAGAARCRALTEDEAEPLMRAALDEKGPAACAALLPKCAAARAEHVHAHRGFTVGWDQEEVDEREPGLLGAKDAPPKDEV